MAENKVTVIGIAGGTGCGKTTVVKRLVEALPPHFVAVVPLDSYYNDTTNMTEEERRGDQLRSSGCLRLEVASSAACRPSCR